MMDRLPTRSLTDAGQAQGHNQIPPTVCQTFLKTTKPLSPFQPLWSPWRGLRRYWRYLEPATLFDVLPRANATSASRLNSSRHMHAKPPTPGP